MAMEVVVRRSSEIACHTNDNVVRSFRSLSPMHTQTRTLTLNAAAWLLFRTQNTHLSPLSTPPHDCWQPHARTTLRERAAE